MVKLLYTFFINLYVIGIKIVSLFNTKAKHWIDGRKDWKNNLARQLKNNTNPIYWFHVASLGEFEQARPVIEMLKKNNSSIKILLTFFSPSGYLVRKEYAFADWVFYLPADTPSNAAYFINTAQPKVAVFVKYDFWYNYIEACAKKNISMIYFSVLLRPNHYLSKWYSVWFVSVLKNIDTFFVQDDYTLNWFKKNNFKNIQLSGDTRFDRALEIIKNRKPIEKIENIINNRTVFIAGSTWQRDDLLLSETFTHSALNNILLIIAPHEVNNKRINEVEQYYKNYNPVRYSQLTNQPTRCVIIDNVGMLSSLYYYAHFCYVGGGFNKTVHNTQEPAAYGKPIFFGKNYQRFNEAIALVNTGGGFSVNDSIELQKKIIELLNNQQTYNNSCCKAQEVIIKGSGSTKAIVNYLSTL